MEEKEIFKTSILIHFPIESQFRKFYLNTVWITFPDVLENTLDVTAQSRFP